MKKIIQFRKLPLALLACSLPLALNAQTGGMASDAMTTNSMPTGRMTSDGMRAPDSSKMKGTMPGTMDAGNSSQMGGMSSGTMNSTPKMGGMSSDGVNAANSPQTGNMASGMMNAAAPPQVRSTAPDFTLKTPDDQPVRLSDLTAKNEVVLVVLRGWPGYQCPFCSRQAHDFVNDAEKLKAAGARVVMVYPGPSDDLRAHAAEFLQDKNWPKDFLLVLDPDYSFTKAYGLRWDAPKETAYPSTFIIGKDGKVAFAHVSKQHGERIDAETVLKALPSAMPMR